MTRIGLISDTHSFLPESVKKFFKDCNQIWHAGDIGHIEVVNELRKIAPIKAVYGNIDGGEIRNLYPEKQFAEIEGMKIFMIHIGGYPGKYQKGVKKILQENKIDLFISGHSHILKVMPDNDLNLLHINPGSVGNSGFHQVKTAVKFEIENGKVQNLEVLEMKR